MKVFYVHNRHARAFLSVQLDLCGHVVRYDDGVLPVSEKIYLRSLRLFNQGIRCLLTEFFFCFGTE